MATVSEHCKLAANHCEAKQWDAAIAELRQALVLKPNHQNALLSLGCIYGAEGQYEEALAQFRLLLQVDANDALGLKHMGKTLRAKAESSRSRKDWTSAQEAFQQILALSPSDANALDELAVISLELGLYLEAAQASKAAARLAPKDRRIAYNQSAIGGQILRQLLLRGKWKEAQQAWKAIR